MVRDYASCHEFLTHLGRGLTLKRIMRIADKSQGIGSEPETIKSDRQVVYTHTRSIDIDPEVLQRNRVITGLENDAVTTAYKMLRTQVLHRMTIQGWTSLAITSAGAGEGKTLTSINLAISLAREVNHTVLLVDADLRRPSISRYFGYTPKFGLCDYLLDNIELSETLFNPGIERLVILPGGNPLPNSSELLSAPKMVNLAEELKTRYSERLVLFDVPPLLMADDLLAFSPNVDAALLVVHEGKTRKDELRRSMELLEEMNLVGTVLNNVKQAPPPYGDQY